MDKQDPETLESVGDEQVFDVAKLSSSNMIMHASTQNKAEHKAEPCLDHKIQGAKLDCAKCQNNNSEFHAKHYEKVEPKSKFKIVVDVCSSESNSSPHIELEDRVKPTEKQSDDKKPEVLRENGQQSKKDVKGLRTCADLAHLLFGNQEVQKDPNRWVKIDGTDFQLNKVIRTILFDRHAASEYKKMMQIIAKKHETELKLVPKGKMSDDRKNLIQKSIKSRKIKINIGGSGATNPSWGKTSTNLPPMTNKKTQGGVDESAPTPLVTSQSKLSLPSSNMSKTQMSQHQSVGSPSKIAALDVCFLFASPLVFGDQSHDQLNFVKEERNIKEAIHESHLAIKFKSQVATHDNFCTVLNQGTRILHISSHGMRSKSNTNQTHLLFEQGVENAGQGRSMDHKSINKLLEGRSLDNCQLVFLAACHSEPVGRLFLEKVEHVICIDKTREVADVVQLDFAKVIYKALLGKKGCNNQKTVCEAFREAKSHCTFTYRESETDLFKLLHHKNHQCYKIEKTEAGDYQCCSDHVQIKEVQEMPQILTYRSQKQDLNRNLVHRGGLLVKIVQTIVGPTRLVLINGAPGIGKSTLLHNALQYILERKYFTGGVIVIDKKQSLDFQSLILSLKNIIIKAVKLPLNTARNLKRANNEQFADKLVEFFNQKSTNPELLLNHQRFSSSKPETVKRDKKKFLLAFDNADNLLNASDNQEFKDLLEHLQNRCPRVTIVMTFAQGTIDQKLKPIYVPYLNAKESAELFMTMAKDKIKAEDVCDLILLDKDFPIEDYIGKAGGLDTLEPNLSNDKDTKKKIMTRLGSSPLFLQEALKNHSLFRDKILPGNPCLIARYAALFNNPHTEINNIVDVYSKVKEHQMPSGQFSDTTASGSTRFKEEQSLWNCTEESLAILKQDEPESYAILHLLCCLPYGLERKDVSSILNLDEEAVEKCILVLNWFSFLEPVAVLSDSVTIGMKTWSELKDQAMSPNYFKFKRNSEGNLKQIQTIKALIKAQRKQGNMDELKPTSEVTRLKIDIHLVQFMMNSFDSEFDSRQKHADAICYFYKQFLARDYKLTSTLSEQDISDSEERTNEPQIIDTEAESGNMRRCLEYLMKLTQQKELEKVTKRESFDQSLKEKLSSKLSINSPEIKTKVLKRQYMMSADFESETIRDIPWTVLRLLMSHAEEFNVMGFIQSLSEEEHEKFQALLRKDPEFGDKNQYDWSGDEEDFVDDGDSDQSDHKPTDAQQPESDHEDIEFGDDWKATKQFGENELAEPQDNKAQLHNRLSAALTALKNKVKKHLLTQKSVPTQKQMLKHLPPNSDSDMSHAAHFILLAAATDYLQSEYEQCLKVCSTNYSSVYIGDNALFQGNLLRLKSLVLEQQAYDAHHDEHNTLKLKQAVEAAKEAIETFRTDQSYGLGLSHYQLGYLLSQQKHLEILADSDTLYSECIQQAKQSFMKSHGYFKELNHLLGMFMSFKSIHQIKNHHPNSSPDKDYTKEEEDELHDSYLEYKQKNGLSYSCSIDRNQGEEISLMTEIVLKSQNTNLYPLAPVMKASSELDLKLEAKPEEPKQLGFSEYDINYFNVLKVTCPLTPQINKYLDQNKQANQQTFNFPDI